MTQLPRLEARISAQERLTAMLHARIEEVSQDMTASFKQLADYQIAMERKIDTRFDKVDARLDKVDARLDKVDARLDKVDARLDKVDARFDKVDARFDKVDARFDKVEANMTSLEERILDAFKQLVTMIDTRLPPQER